MKNKKSVDKPGYPHRRHRTRKVKRFLKPPWVRLYKKKKKEMSVDEIEREY